VIEVVNYLKRKRLWSLPRFHDQSLELNAPRIHTLTRQSTTGTQPHRHGETAMMYPLLRVDVAELTLARHVLTRQRLAGRADRYGCRPPRGVRDGRGSRWATR
jgi:hypothetical protein